MTTCRLDSDLLHQIERGQVNDSSELNDGVVLNRPKTASPRHLVCEQCGRPSVQELCSRCEDGNYHLT